jgi:hypothetical protein
VSGTADGERNGRVATAEQTSYVFILAVGEMAGYDTTGPR